MKTPWLYGLCGLSGLSGDSQIAQIAHMAQNNGHGDQGGDQVTPPSRSLARFFAATGSKPEFAVGERLPLMAGAQAGIGLCIWAPLQYGQQVTRRAPEPYPVGIHRGGARCG